MSEGGESAMFKHLFKSWTEKGQTKGLGNTHTVGKIGAILKNCHSSQKFRNILLLIYFLKCLN